MCDVDAEGSTTLEQLKAELTRAMELSTDGELTVDRSGLIDGSMSVYIGESMIAEELDESDAQAIAIRHNLSAEVLRLLEELADWRVADGLGDQASPERHRQLIWQHMAATSSAVERATKAEASLTALKARRVDDIANAYKMGRDYVSANDCEEDPDV